MGCTPQLQLGWKAITIEGNSGTPFSDKYISCCCLFISSLHRHQYLPGPITPLAVKLSGIILKSIYHFFGLDFLIMQWTGVLESTLDYEVCFIFSHSDKISKFPQLLGGNHGNSCFLGSTLFFHTSSSPGQFLVRAFAGDALPDLLKGSPAVGFWGRMLKKRAEE